MREFMLPEEIREQKMIPPVGRIRLVIDSDAKNEVDDQFAISWALRSRDRFDVEAIYAVPFSHKAFQNNLGNMDFPDIEPPAEGMELSYQEILKLMRFLGEPTEGRVFRGADRFMPGPGVPVDSEAVQDLIRRGMADGEPLFVVAIGAATNIASALLLEPRLAEKITLVWLGGQALYSSHANEFNCAQDIYAAQTLFESGVSMIWVPCMTIASGLVLTDDDVRCKLMGKSPIGTYLAQIVLDMFPGLEKATTRAAYHRKLILKGRDDLDEGYLSQFTSRHVAWSRPIWDISTIAFLKNPNWVQSQLIPAPVLGSDCTWQPIPEGRHRIRVANYCQRDLIIGDMIACLTQE